MERKVLGVTRLVPRLVRRAESLPINIGEKPVRIRNLFSVVSVALLAITSQSRGDIITQWNFNSLVPDGIAGTGTTTPSTGVGTASMIGGVIPVGGGFLNGNNSGGSSDPVVNDDSAWRTRGYPAQGTSSGTAGVRFNVSTMGQENIFVSWDHLHSLISSRYSQFQYSVDGLTFSSAGLLNDGIFSAAATETLLWANSRTVDLSAIASVANNPNFAFQIVSIFDPTLGNAYSSPADSGYTGGEWTFDMVTVNGVVPEPSTLGLVVSVGLALFRRRKA